MTDGAVVIVGASLAGLRTAEALRREGFSGRIVLVGDEPDRPYDRPPLSKAYLRETEPADLRFPIDIDVDLLLGRAAVGVDAEEGVVELADGSTLGYDHLVVATGTVPVVPDGLDVGLRGVHLLRTLDDARHLREDLHRSPRRVVVIGAGFIGLEIASTCHALGTAVTLVDPVEVPLLRPLGRVLAERLHGRHVEAGTDFRLGLTAHRLVGADGTVTAVALSDGSVVDADVVVVAVGVRPGTDWLASSGIALENGVACGDDLRSRTHANVWAVGDVARWPHPVFDADVRVEHWMNAVEGADVVARGIMGEAVTHAAVPSFWSDQLGWKIQGIGMPALADEVAIDDSDGTVGVYRRAGQTVGAVTFDRPRRLVPIRRALAKAARPVTVE